MPKQDITSRKDVSFLVRNFYAKVRVHADLGPIFNGIVNDWESHLERLIDFWEIILLNTGPGAGKFNPVKVHKEVDQVTGYKIHQALFGHWLEMWFSSLDEHFEGANAHFAKEHARKMAHILFFRIMDGRMENKN
ncbi:group III truncated hemoglobin [Anditalea andensis]|uniref:Globin n=1 Tax=Anditalea andensis TaxID=1048983 RepID=A0A074L3H9_9BACT|nr:group III truncated hemoglobin [Anditalea andensis]KEO75724.1 globin [Anditalea andensis]